MIILLFAQNTGMLVSSQLETFKTVIAAEKLDFKVRRQLDLDASRVSRLIYIIAIGVILGRCS